MKTRNKNNQWKRGLLGSTAAFLLFSWALAPVYASDTEVYSREVILTGESSPVMMMVLGTSDSMNKCMTNNTLDCQGLPTSRVETLGRALHKVLFGNDGTDNNPVVKPAPGFLKMGYVRYRPDNSAAPWLRYGAEKSLDGTLFTTAADFSQKSVLVRVPNAASDAKESAGVTDASGDLVMDKGAAVAVGLRFEGVLVPRGAKITKAELAWNEKASGGNPAPNIIVKPELGDLDADLFTVTPISARIYPTDLETSQFDTVPYNKSKISILKSVQAIVNHASWCGGQAFSIKLNTDGKTRTLKSYENAAGNAAEIPRLSIEYTLPETTPAAPGTGTISNTCLNVQRDIVKTVISGLDDVEWRDGSSSIDYADPALNPSAMATSSSGTTVKNTVAVRFREVPALRNATIQKALLYVTGFTQDGVTGPEVPIRVRGFNPATGDLPEFCTRDADTNVVDCSAFDRNTAVTVETGVVGDPEVNFTLPTATNEDTNYVVNVTNLVQDIVNNANWAADNAMGFKLRNEASTTNSTVALASMDAGPSRAMTLHISALQPYTNLTNLLKTVRQDLDEEITGELFAKGSISLTPTFAEAARYMLGLPPTGATGNPTFPETITYDHDANTSTADLSAPHPVAGTYTDDATREPQYLYTSPVDTSATCSANYVYMLSDGVPDSMNSGANWEEINPDSVCTGTAANTDYPVVSGSNVGSNFQCLQLVADQMAKEGNQIDTKIRTNAVYFGPLNEVNEDFRLDMDRLADKGAGFYYEATDEATLLRSMLDTLRALIDVSGTITAPGVAVNQFNRLTHLDQLYYSVFDPNTKHARWLGNVKRYRLAFYDVQNSDGTVTRDAKIVDVNGNNAIDETTSFFSSNAKSFWSADVDGDKATMGGVAKRLPAPAERRILVNVDHDEAPLALRDLRSLSADNTTDAAEVMGFTDPDQFENLRRWILGYKVEIVDHSTTPARIKIEPADTTTELRAEVGGVLHSQPVLVNYGYDDSHTADEAAADAELQDNTVYFSDMEGMLHAIDARTGVEQFAFLPVDLLNRLDDLAINPTQNLPDFGLDLTWTVYRHDDNRDFKINRSIDPDDFVMLYGGMRMGGRNYYALDVTDRGAPELKWVIKGGTAGPFANLGQTWSKPVLADLKLGSTVKTVMLFGGGYDPKHETAGFDSTNNAADTQGKQIYIVDPETGSVIWWASNTADATLNVPEMNFSIPAEPKVVDTNNDGLIDAAYFGDLGGQLFRVDINNTNTASLADGSTLVTRVHRLANVGQGVTADTVNHRRFYETPSIARISSTTAGGLPYLTVAIGSGYRSHPLDLPTQDYFYVFKDKDALRGDLHNPPDGAPLQDTITPDDLATVSLATSTGVDVSTTMGWKLALPAAGEKVISTALSLFGEVIFTSYVPDVTSTTSCEPVVGLSNLYRLRLVDGATVDTNGDGVVNSSDSRVQAGLVHGMAGSPQVLVGEGGRNAIITGTGVIRNRNLGGATGRLRWYEKAKTPGAVPPTPSSPTL